MIEFTDADRELLRTAGKVLFQMAKENPCDMQVARLAGRLHQLSSRVPAMDVAARTS
jgi:hypothetical protein